MLGELLKDFSDFGVVRRGLFSQMRFLKFFPISLSNSQSLPHAVRRESAPLTVILWI